MLNRLLVFALLLTACSKSGSNPTPSPTPDPAPCTVPSETTRVYNGTPIPSTTYPYVGALAFYDTTGEGLCTASLVCPNVLLTAAHCFYEQGPASNPVNANAATSAYVFSLSTSMPFTGTAADTSNLPSDATTLTNVVIHPNWAGATSLSSIDNDMAMAVLSAPFAPASFAPLAAVLPVSTGVTGTIMGYGESLENDGSTQGSFGAGTKRDGTILYQGTLPAQGTSAADPDVILTQRQSGANTQDTCGGDSGSPLIVNGQDLGTLSGGDAAGCGVPVGTVANGEPVQGIGFYSSAVGNGAWIQQEMQALCSSAPAPTPAPCSTN